MTLLPGDLVTVNLQLAATTRAFDLRGNNTEVPALANGSTVIPTTSPSGLTGKVVVRGAGSVSYSPLANGDGLTFRTGGSQNTDTGFLAFSGAPVQALFNVNQGDLTFNLQSGYTYSERLSLGAPRFVFQVDDGSQSVVYFSVSAASPNVSFQFSIGSATVAYFLPHGQEDILFGKGVIAKLRLTWDGSVAAIFWMMSRPLRRRTHRRRRSGIRLPRSRSARLR